MKFRSIDEVIRYFCPQKRERDKIKKMTPEELAKYWGESLAQGSLKKLEKVLKNDN